MKETYSRELAKYFRPILKEDSDPALLRMNRVGYVASVVADAEGDRRSSELRQLVRDNRLDKLADVREGTPQDDMIAWYAGISVDANVVILEIDSPADYVDKQHLRWWHPVSRSVPEVARLVDEWFLIQWQPRWFRFWRDLLRSR